MHVHIIIRQNGWRFPSIFFFVAGTRDVNVNCRSGIPWAFDYAVETWLPFVVLID